MAKKEKKEIKTIFDKLQGEYGDGIISNAQYIFDKPKMLIPISPAFDNSIKGFYEGSLISLAGKSQCGKTTFALDFARKCQKSEYCQELWHPSH